MRLELPQYLTLCMICRRAPQCSLPRVHSQPVWSCDEFVAAQLPGERDGGPDHGTATDVEHDLCSTCRRREGCAFPRPNGGVWHCEAYS